MTGRPTSEDDETDSEDREQAAARRFQTLGWPTLRIERDVVVKRLPDKQEDASLFRQLRKYEVCDRVMGGCLFRVVERRGVLQKYCKRRTSSTITFLCNSSEIPFLIVKIPSRSLFSKQSPSSVDIVETQSEGQVQTKSHMGSIDDLTVFNADKNPIFSLKKVETFLQRSCCCCRSKHGVYKIRPTDNRDENKFVLSTWEGFGHHLFQSYKTYLVEFPEFFTNEERYLLLASSFFVNLRYF